MRKFSVLITLLFQLHLGLLAQGVLVDKSVDSSQMDTSLVNFDPARYHKIQFIDFKFGRSVSDDRGFQSLLKSYDLNPGSKNFYELGFNYQFLIKKVNLGGKGNLAFQQFDDIPRLWHASWQGILGYTLIRKDKKIITLNSNFGVQTSTIRFGSVPPAFLAGANVSHTDSKLFQKQFIIGPTVNFNKMILKNNIEQGVSLGFEAGVNFAPFKGIWKYGFRDEEDVFIGDVVNNMPQAAPKTYFASLKLGFWAAR